MSRRDKGVLISDPIVKLLKRSSKVDRTVAVLLICNYWDSGVLPPADCLEGARSLFEAWLEIDSEINRFKWKEVAHEG
jgi:hypothetical protein